MFKMFNHIKLSQTAKYYRSWWMHTDDRSLRPWLWLQSACVNCRNMQKLTMTVASNKVGASTADFESMADPSAFLDTCPCSESYAAVRLGQLNNCILLLSQFKHDAKWKWIVEIQSRNRDEQKRHEQTQPASPRLPTLLQPCKWLTRLLSLWPETIRMNRNYSILISFAEVDLLKCDKTWCFNTLNSWVHLRKI